MDSVAIQSTHAFTEFVESIEPRLRISLMAAYGTDRGREATAEALAYAWEHWDRISDMEFPVAYLFRVGRSRTRSLVWRSLLPTTDSGEPPLIEPKLPQALQGLSRRQRVCVVLVHAYAWTHLEVSELLGVSVPTVKTHVQRGLVSLRATLEVYADD